MLNALAPVLFVLIWSTGFIVAKAAVPHASPELFLTARLALTALVLGIAAVAAREAMPRGRRLGLHIAAGMALHGFYLGLSWWAVSRGMPAGIMSLFGALQPLIVAVASFALFGERLAARSWGGLAIAIFGVGCVLLPALEKGGAGGATPIATAAAIVAIVAMAAGTMIQRGPLAGDPIAISGAIQNGGGTVVTLIGAWLMGGTRWDNSAMLYLSLGWSVLALSAAGLSLLVWMVRHQGATRVSALLLLVPALGAIEAWWLFGEKLTLIQILGFLFALGGVLLARAKPRETIAEPA